MVTANQIMIFVFVFLFLLGFFRFIYFIISALHKLLTRKSKENAKSKGVYRITRLVEVREQRIKI